MVVRRLIRIIYNFNIFYYRYSFTATEAFEVHGNTNNCAEDNYNTNDKIQNKHIRLGCDAVSVGIRALACFLFLFFLLFFMRSAELITSTHYGRLSTLVAAGVINSTVLTVTSISKSYLGTSFKVGHVNSSLIGITRNTLSIHRKVKQRGNTTFYQKSPHIC